jgi:hypothetical protein
MKRTKITLEIDEVTIIRRLKKSQRGECTECGARMLTLTEAEALSKVAAQELCGLISQSKLHFKEVGGVLLICSNSLREINQDLPNASDEQK